MEPQKSRFHRTLLIVLVILFVLTLAALNYANWAAEPIEKNLYKLPNENGVRLC